MKNDAVQRLGASAGLDRLFRPAFEHFIDQPVLARGLGALEVVALGVAGDGVEGLPGVLGQDLVEALLLAAGAKGKRYALPNSRVMIHQPLGGFQGQASDIEIHTREILTMRDRLNQLLAKHTGQPVERIAKDTDRDNFMDAEVAKAYGMVDMVLDRRPDESIQAS